MERLDNGLLVILEMKNLIYKSRNIIIEGKNTFINNARNLASTTSSFVCLLQNYIYSLNNKDPIINFLSDILQSCIYAFEQGVVKVIQTRKVALQNPLSISSFYASYRFSDTITSTLENILWLTQLIDSTDTEAKYLLTQDQLDLRTNMFIQAKKLASDVKYLLDTVESSTKSAQTKIDEFLSLVFKLSGTANSFTRLLDNLPNSFQLHEQLTSSIETIILFSSHIAYETDDSFSGLQKARSEFILCLKDIVISFHKSLNTELTPKSLTPRNTPGPNKRAGVRVIANKEQSESDKTSRSLDISEGATNKLDNFLLVVKQAESLYITLQLIESMKLSTWFNNNYNKEDNSNKLLLIKQLHTKIVNNQPSAPRIRKVIPSQLNNTKHVRASIIGNFSQEQEDIGGILLSVANTNAADINSMQNISVQRTLKRSNSVIDKFQAKRLSIHSFTETICLFHASTEGLLRSFQPEIPNRVELNEVIQQGLQCCSIIEKILVLTSMIKNENATEPPPKLEQLLLQSIFQELVDIHVTNIEPDEDTLKATRRDGVFSIIKYLIVTIKELQIDLETISIQICSIVRQFQLTKDTTIAGIFGIIAPITLYLQKLKLYFTYVKTYNFATAEINMTNIALNTNEQEIKFWEAIESENIIQRPKIIEKISLNMLIGLVTSPKTDVRLQYIFLRTYPSFITDKKLLLKLKERFFVPRNINLQVTNAIRHSVIKFISKWIEVDIKFLDKKLIEDTLSFLKDSNIAIHKPTEHLLKQALLPEKVVVKPSEQIVQWSNSDNFMKLDDQCIAEQLTLIDYEIYRKISKRELLQCAWSNPKIRYRAINVRRLIERQNQLSFWITTMIVSGRTIKERIEIWEKWIRIAICLKELNNFNSLMGIIAASNMAVTQRLHHTKNGLKKQLLVKFEELGKLMAPHKSWALFREQLKNCTAPAIPYLGVFLTDLTFIHDGNKDLIDGMINWKKIIMIYRIIETVRKFQKIPYSIKVQNPIYTWVLQLPGLDDENNYQLSLLREPKKIELKALQALENNKII